MNDNIKFSITVPAYKAQFLKECIDSILAQTYQNFELIIVNDNSPQNLEHIVSKYHDERIHYYKNKVGFGAEHVVGNWNKCLEYATGDYLICMGDDDKLLPCCLEEYVKLINKYPGLGLYHGWTEIINEDNILENILPQLPDYECTYSFIYSRLSGRVQFIGDFLYNISRLRNHGGFYNLPYAWGSDNLSAFIAAISDGVAHTQVPVFQYRQNHQTISSSDHNREKMESVYKQFQWLGKFLENSSLGVNPTELSIHDLILSKLSNFFLQNVKYYMVLDMKTSNKFSALCYWKKQSQHYGINTKLIFRMLIKSMI